MKIVSWWSLARIGIGLGVLFAAGRFMCHCGGVGGAMSPGASISQENLQRHVQFLAGELGEHNVFNPGQLRRAAEYIEQEWRAQGYEVTPYPYRVRDIECANLEITRRGTSRPEQIILIGAHYDSVEGCPGANDNGSGVAALLEISRHLPPAPCTVRFVAFVNEEPPFFQTAEMGSRVYAKLARQRGDDIRAMLSLETIGYYSDAPGSQRYPAFFRFFYPDRGNFIAFVSDLRSRSLLHKTVAAFRAHVDFPAECCATFAAVPGVDWSDQSSFWREGYRAVMVTDTAPFRYPYYHSPEDTPDKIDYAALARVTEGLAGVATTLAH